MSTDRATGDALPAALYAGPEAFQRERRTVFQTAWLLLARSATLREPGAYVAQSLGGWPIFAIADSTGAASVYRNVCRHQGLPLFDTGAGNCAEIRCRYHGWTYGADGRFKTAPPQVMPPDPADAVHHLDSVASKAFRGLLFVYLGGAPTALEPAVAELDGADFEALPFQGETITDIDANWKVVMEHALAAAPAGVSRRAVWPTLLIDAGAGGVVLHQVIPRAFQRTRIHHHRYGAAPAERTAAEANALKAAAAAAQAEVGRGAVPDLASTPALAAFRARVRSAHAAVT
ncbi:MAG TPA: Rieske 2Fe-2S domain-containing protein [Stellaceae bacterium]|nr:Rieske 2Fe-2S domain-containing protein [Stellaceae bacterium]